MTGRSWDDLHLDPRFRPSYPSESVVRFLARRVERGTDGGQQRVLDHGCGAGRHLRLIRDFYHDALGLDLSLGGLKNARERLGDIALANSSMTALPIRPGSVDAVISFGVLIYNDTESFARSVSEIHAALRPGGWLLAVTRTTDDCRVDLGRKIDRRTVLVEEDLTNEAGMTMHFLDRSAVDREFGVFDQVTVDRIDHTADGGRIYNSDWVIEARR